MRDTGIWGDVLVGFDHLFFVPVNQLDSRSSAVRGRSMFLAQSLNHMMPFSYLISTHFVPRISFFQFPELLPPPDHHRCCFDSYVPTSLCLASSYSSSAVTVDSPPEGTSLTL